MSAPDVVIDSKQRWFSWHDPFAITLHPTAGVMVTAG